MKRIVILFILFFGFVGFSHAQRTIEGMVTDTDGLPLIGANVLVPNSTIGTITDIDGSFSLEVPDGTTSLEVSYTGFGSQVVDISAEDYVSVSLSEGEVLDEVVVTALGISRDQKSLGYAVQEVGGEQLAQTKETNIVNALQGQVAGVQIQGSPSTIGGSSRITIRGSNSFLGNNQPLFVVDGVPVDNSNFASDDQQAGFGGAQAYDYGNTAQDIDPSSIESMSVLKGAAATALYGQRGANGVILIKTKDGSRNQGLGVDVNSSITWDNATNLIPHQQSYGGGSINPNTSHGFNVLTQDGVEYLYPTYSKDGSWGPKYDPNVQVRHWDSWDPESANYKETRPWVAPANDYSAYFNTGTTYNNSVGLSGGNDLGSFRLGYTNINQSGIIPNSKLNRNTITFNSNYQIHDRIHVGLSGNYVNSQVEGRNVTGYNNANPLQGFNQWWQTQVDVERLKESQTNFAGEQQSWNANGPVTDANGNFVSWDGSPAYFDNPVWVRNNILQEDTRNRLFGNANLTINLADGLDLTSQFGTDFYQFSDIAGNPNESVDVGYYGENERRFQENNFETRLSYRTELDRVSITGIVGGNVMRQFSKRTSMNTAGGLSLERYYNIANSASPIEFETYEVQKGINSLFGTASFGWDSWLYLDVSARNDWSSTLPEDNNSYFYPAVSLSAALTELPTFQNIDHLSYAKVRVSFAQAGSDADPYSLYPVYSPSTPNINGYPRYGVPNAQPNPELKPELTTEYEAGLDLNFFNNRLGFGVTYFDRTTEDQIFNVPSSSTTGYTSRVLNAGEMRNWGWEFTLNATPVVTNDFQWNVGVNLYRQNNEVVELLKDADGNTVVEGINVESTWAANVRVAEGYPYMALFGQDYIYDDAGNRVVGEDGMYLFTDERVYLGSAIADWTGGFNTSFSYMGLTASALFDWQIGGKIHSTSLQWSKYSGMHPETVEFNGESDIRANGLLLPGVKEDGTPNDIRVNALDYHQLHWDKAINNIHDASYLKFREVRLAYKLPSSVLGNSPFRNATIGVFGRNLGILASDLPYLDPQGVIGAGNVQGLENAQVPSTRSFGVNIQFNL